MEKITVTSRGDIITAKSGNKYFMLEDETQRELICFVPELHEHLLIGTEVDADIAPPRKEGGTPSISQVYVSGKPLVEEKTKQGAGRSYGKSKEELAQIKQLADTQIHSIESQVAFKGLVELCVADRLKIDRPEMLDALAWALTRIGDKDEALQVHKEIATALKSEPDKEVRPDEARQETIGEPIDMEWLKASLEGWTDVVGWMRKQYMITGGAGVKGVLGLMTPLQVDHFIKEVKDRLLESFGPPF